MTTPTISDAKALATKHRKRGVIVLAFEGGGYSGSSYGMTRSDCRVMGITLDAICDGIAAGLIVLPPWVEDRMLLRSDADEEIRRLTARVAELEGKTSE